MNRTRYDGQRTGPQPRRRLLFPPVVYWSISGVAFTAMVIFWIKGQNGSTLFGFLSVFSYPVGVWHILKGFWAHEQQTDARALDELVSNPTNSEGQAKWATIADIKKQGMDRQTGLFLGSLNGQDLSYPGETHLLTIAPPGAGKGTSIVIPTLLNYAGSVVVTDPKGELFAITAKHRRNRLGHKIVVLCPWADKLGKELNIPIPDHGYNPLNIIQRGPDMKDEAELISSLLLPGHADMKPDDAFWLDGGQSILTAFMLYLKSKEQSEGPLTLPLLRQYLHLGPDELEGCLYEMSVSGFDTDSEGAPIGESKTATQDQRNLSATIREYGGKLLGTYKRSDKQFEGLLGSAQKAVRIYDRLSPVGGHVSHGEIDFKSLKYEPTTIYLIMPSDRAHTHAGWLNLVMSLAIELVGRDRSNRRVLFLLDEMANMGYMPSILRAMAQYRGQGVQVWSIIQQLGQLQHLYGKAGSIQFVGTCELINLFGVWDPETIEFVSKWLGQTTARNFSYNVRKASTPGDFMNVDYSANDKAHFLMRPEDIRTMSENEQLIFYRNVAPIRAMKVHYHLHSKWRTWAEPNPYRR